MARHLALEGKSIAYPADFRVERPHECLSSGAGKLPLMAELALSELKEQNRPQAAIHQVVYRASRSCFLADFCPDLLPIIRLGIYITDDTAKYARIIFTIENNCVIRLKLMGSIFVKILRRKAMSDDKQYLDATIDLDENIFSVPVTPGSKVNVTLRITPKKMNLAGHPDAFGSSEVEIGGEMFVVEAGRTSTSA